MLRRKSERGEPFDAAAFREGQAPAPRIECGSSARWRTGYSRCISAPGGCQRRCASWPPQQRALRSPLWRALLARRHIEDQGIADHLYRIAQEATGNAIRHGNANAVRIRLTVLRAGGLMLAVIDNGAA
jgi:hypothetical protein